MRLLRKVINFADTEVAAYNGIKEDSLAPVDKFVNKTGRKVFDLSLVYPLRDNNLARLLLPLQEEISGILGDGARMQGHFYPAAEELHMTLFHLALRSPLLSEAHKQGHREAALELFLNEKRKEFFVSPKIHFSGGSAAQDAVIIHGYNFAELNESRLRIARYGLRRVFEHGQGYEIRPRLFDRKRAHELARQIFYDDKVYPNLAHLTLLRFGRPLTANERLEINALLDSIDFGETVFSELGLYEFSSFGVFSSGQQRARLIFTGPEN
ncbi:MAG: hypothetical protein LBJ25_00785 [Candidatus Margulisbacteria bacterium]|jgi:hypothetical protein|nr:hypothetical protein [Candidatus Margulisiibacteriota bacterium]